MPLELESQTYHYCKKKVTENGVQEAIVFAKHAGIDKLRKKIDEYKNPRKKKEDGTFSSPKNAELIQSIGSIRKVDLLGLWRSPKKYFPSSEDENQCFMWEIWLDKTDLGKNFRNKSENYSVNIGKGYLDFPESIVVIASASRGNLQEAIEHLDGVMALTKPATTADVICGADIVEQKEWLNDLEKSFKGCDNNSNKVYVTLLDTGVNLSNELIESALLAEDRYTVRSGWGIEDSVGHGTLMAGLILFGDLLNVIQEFNDIILKFRLESVKICNGDRDYNKYDTIPSITIEGIKLAEKKKGRIRVYYLASTTEDDFPHDGAPTSWSAVLDQLAAGRAGDEKVQRLIAVSAGNKRDLKSSSNYLDNIDSEDNEIESPAQAWNVITVGGYTEKNILNEVIEEGEPEAPFGDVSPHSRTASWEKYWPIKPDIVCEAGNRLRQGEQAYTHSDLSLLTFSPKDKDNKPFAEIVGTSPATALAAGEIAQLRVAYPQFWPETIRALYVSSACWTAQMRSHLRPRAKKGDYTPLFQRYGYGVPNLSHALKSAGNAFTLIIEDTLVPYRMENGSKIYGDMKFFRLPWPLKGLRKLGSNKVKLRIALSTFIIPNPSEAARGNKYNYASHNLRFEINRVDEDEKSFLARINKSQTHDGPKIGSPSDWEFGPDRRNVGSLHIDQLHCMASDLACQNLIGVYPIAGWWKNEKLMAKEKEVRFSLIVEIDAGEAEIDLYAEVEAIIENRTQAVVEV